MFMIYFFLILRFCENTIYLMEYWVIFFILFDELHRTFRVYIIPIHYLLFLDPLQCYFYCCKWGLFYSAYLIFYDFWSVCVSFFRIFMFFIMLKEALFFALSLLVGDSLLSFFCYFIYLNWTPIGLLLLSLFLHIFGPLCHPKCLGNFVCSKILNNTNWLVLEFC